MSEFLIWFMCGIASAGVCGFAAYWFVSSQFAYRGYEPVIDLDQVQREIQSEMDAEFAPLTVEQGARLV